MSAPRQSDDDVFEQAVAWHGALARDDADWDAYMSWLDQDPAHRVAFDEVALLDRMIEDHAPSLQREEDAGLADRAPRNTRKPLWIGGSIAAALAAAIALPMLTKTPADVVYHAAAQSRSITLAGDTRVTLAPRSSLVVQAGDPTKLRLAAGEAYFAVPHVAGRTLSIRAGDYDVRDIGTKFSVNLTPSFLTVAVAEGNVSVQPQTGNSAAVPAGKQLLAERRRGRARLSTVVASDVAGWRRGRLVYADAPLDVVVADLSRYTGKGVSVDPRLRNRKFSGVLAIANGPGMFRDLAELMSISSRPDGAGVRFVPVGER